MVFRGMGCVTVFMVKLLSKVQMKSGTAPGGDDAAASEGQDGVSCPSGGWPDGANVRERALSAESGNQKKNGKKKGVSFYRGGKETPFG